MALGGTATAKEVRAYLLANIDNYNPANVSSVLNCISVNSLIRIHYGYNREVRRTDQGSIYDLLYKEGQGPKAMYHLYDQEKHGVWEIVKEEQPT